MQYLSILKLSPLLLNTSCIIFLKAQFTFKFQQAQDSFDEEARIHFYFYYLYLLELRQND